MLRLLVATIALASLPAAPAIAADTVPVAVDAAPEGPSHVVSILTSPVHFVFPIVELQGELSNDTLTEVLTRVHKSSSQDPLVRSFAGYQLARVAEADGRR